MYTAYYYDSRKEQFPGFDSNELYIEGQFVGMITEVRSAEDIRELVDDPEYARYCILIIDEKSCKNISINNFNPCPEEMD